MGNAYYMFAIILVVLWAIGYLGYNVGELIHILLVVAGILIMLRLVKGEKKLSKNYNY